MRRSGEGIRLDLDRLEDLVNTVSLDFSVVKAFDGSVEVELDSKEVRVIACIPVSAVDFVVKHLKDRGWRATGEYLVEAKERFYAVITFRSERDLRKELEKAKDLVVIE